MSKWSNMPPHGFADEDDSEDEGLGPSSHKGKPRRKSHQRPQGSDQIRQAFSKRKKGLVLKAFQLHSLTDAKVFMFIVNDKGTAWAYATPDYSASLNVQVLKQLRSLANVPEQAKLFTEVIPGQANAKNTSSNGSSDQTGTQRTDPSTEYVLPSTRTATGSLPSRSRSSYSSDAQASGQQAGDRLARTASNAAPVRALQATPQSDEHSPTMPKGRPPSGSSMACGTHASAAAAAQGGYSFQQYQQHLQQQQLAGGVARGPGMESPTPCVYNILGQPISAQDSPSDACGGSPSSKLMPPPDALTSGRMLAANAQAAAAAADNQALAAAAAAAAAMEGGFRGPVVKTEMGTDSWVPMQQQQLQDGTSQQLGWGFNSFAAQQQMYMQQQAYALQQQQQAYVQQQYQPGSYQQQLLGPSSVPGSKAESMDIPYSAAAGAPAGVPWGSLPAGIGAGMLSNAAAADTGILQQQQQQQQQAVDAFESMQRGLAPLRLAKGPRDAAGDADGSRSAPAAAAAAAAGMTSVLGPPSQWLTFPDEACPGVAAASALRTASDAGVYGGMAGSGAYSSYAPSPSSCANQASGAGSTPVAGAPQAANAAAALLAQRGGSVSQGSSPTAALSQRMTSILAMNSPQTSPLHPSAMSEQQQPEQQQQYRPHPRQQQQAGWTALMGGACSSSAPMMGPGRMMGTSGSSRAPGFQQGWQQQLPLDAQQQQHNQGAFMPQTDDLVSDPIMDMLMDQPLGQLAPQSHTRATTADEHHPKHQSIMEATLHPQQQQQQQQQQQSQQQQQQQDAGSFQVVTGTQGVAQGGQAAAAAAPPPAPAGPPSGTSMVWGQSPAAAPAAAAAGGDADIAVRSLLSQLPPPPKSEADKAAWAAEVRSIVNTLPLQQRQSLLAKLSQQQCLMAQGASGGGSSPPQAPPAAPPAAAAGNGYGRVFGGKQRGPSRLSSNSLAVGPDGASGDATGAAAVGPAPGSTLLQHQQLPVGSTCFLGSGAVLPSSSSNSAQQKGQLTQQFAGSPGAPAAAATMQAPACSMGPPPAPAYCASMGFAATAMDLDPHSRAASMPPPMSGSGVAMPGFSQGGISSSAGGQMLPLPQQQQSLPVSLPAPEPALTACGGGSGSNALFAGTVQQQPGGSSSSSAFMQPPPPVATGRAGALVSEAKSNQSSRCPSPLKRGHDQPGSPFCNGSAAAAAAAEEGASPMKRVCFATAFSDAQPQQHLPEPPSFATLLQAEASGEDDAIAWATAASDSLKRGTGSCVSLGLGVGNTFGSLESFPSAFLRLGSLQHGDSLALLSALPDLGEADPIVEEPSVCPTAGAGAPAGAAEQQGVGRQAQDGQQQQPS